MFSYPHFLERAVDAGLREVTFSIHGPDATTHDHLVGVPGAFQQTVEGLRQALRSERLVTNVDIVLNARNIDMLPEMLEKFSAWGVREFDLLHIIPFGAAWLPENRELFYRPEDHLGVLRDAFRFARKQGLRLWLNRFPPQAVEGFEYLIQDPHKLLTKYADAARSFRVSWRKANRCGARTRTGAEDAIWPPFAGFSKNSDERWRGEA